MKVASLDVVAVSRSDEDFESRSRRQRKEGGNIPTVTYFIPAVYI